MKICIVGLLLISSSLGYSEECSKNVQELKKGAIAPCSGFLFSPKQEEKVRGIVETSKLQEAELEVLGKEIEIYKYQIDNYKDIVKLQQEESKVWRDSYITLSKEYVSDNSSSQWQNILWMLSGVGITAIAGWTIHQVGE